MAVHKIKFTAFDGWKKYLIPKDVKHIELYHGTSSVFLEGMLKGGLQPRGLTNNSNYHGHIISHPEKVYLAARAYAIQGGKKAVDRHGGNLTIVRLVMNTSNLIPDDDTAIMSVDVCKIPNDWRDSLEYNGTCATMGIVKSIQDIQICNGYNHFDVLEKIAVNSKRQ